METAFFEFFFLFFQAHVLNRQCFELCLHGGLVIRGKGLEHQATPNKIARGLPLSLFGDKCFLLCIAIKGQHGLVLLAVSAVSDGKRFPQRLEITHGGGDIKHAIQRQLASAAVIHFDTLYRGKHVSHLQTGGSGSTAGLHLADVYTRAAINGPKSVIAPTPININEGRIAHSSKR